jgi:hypothetical protein
MNGRMVDRYATDMQERRGFEANGDAATSTELLGVSSREHPGLVPSRWRSWCAARAFAQPAGERRWGAPILRSGALP